MNMPQWKHCSATQIGRCMVRKIKVENQVYVTVDGHLLSWAQAAGSNRFPLRIGDLKVQPDATISHVPWLSGLLKPIRFQLGSVMTRFLPFFFAG